MDVRGKTVTGMAEYIEREATIKLLRSLGSRDYRREKGTIQEAIKMVSFPEYTPSADVAPVRHGRWLHTEEPLGWKDVDCMECSACHDSWIIEEDYCFDDMPLGTIVRVAAQRWTEVKIDERRNAGSLRGNRERYVPH